MLLPRGDRFTEMKPSDLSRKAFSVTTKPAEHQTTKEKGAVILFEDRLSDSPYIERVWRCHSERGGTFTSVAASHFEMALTRLRGETFLTLRGPETKATPVECP